MAEFTIYEPFQDAKKKIGKHLSQCDLYLLEHRNKDGDIE